MIAGSLRMAGEAAHLAPCIRAGKAELVEIGVVATRAEGEGIDDRQPAGMPASARRLSHAVFGGEASGPIDPIADLLVDGLLLASLTGVRELGVDQDRPHRVEEIGLLQGQGAQQRIHDPLLRQKPGIQR